MDGWDDRTPDPPFAPIALPKPAASRKQQKKKAQAARRKSTQRTHVATSQQPATHDLPATGPIKGSVPTPLLAQQSPMPPGCRTTATAAQPGSKVVTNQPAARRAEVVPSAAGTLKHAGCNLDTLTEQYCIHAGGVHAR